MGRALWIVASASLLVLGACQKKTSATSDTGSGAPPASVSAPSTPASAPHPQRKPGLWSMTVRSDRTTQTSRICVDTASDKTLGIAGQPPGASPCRENRVTPRPGGGYDLATVCDLGDAGRVTTRGTITGDLTSRYQVEMQSTTRGAAAPQMNGARRVSIAARWQGPCPPSLQPGDIEVAGTRMNLLRGRGPGG